MEDALLQELRKEIEWVEAKGHGEVIVKIKNGVPYRILVTKDKLVHLTIKKESV